MAKQSSTSKQPKAVQAAVQQAAAVQASVQQAAVQPAPAVFSVRAQLVKAGVTTAAQITAAQQTITPAQLQAGVSVNAQWQIVPNGTPGSTPQTFVMFSKTNCQGHGIKASTFVRCTGGDRGVFAPQHPGLQVFYCQGHRYMFSGWYTAWQQWQASLAPSQPSTPA